MRTLVISGIVIAIVAAMAIIPVSAASEPTVMISEYHVNPEIMMPDGLGTLTVTLKNTATSASEKENAGLVTNEFTSTRVTDINVDIESVELFGNGVTVLSETFDHIGELGPGQSVPITFTIRAPSASGIYNPEVRIRTSGASARYPVMVNVNTPIGIEKASILILESTVPDSVNPGDEIPVNLTVRNRGETRADDVTLKIDNASALIAPRMTDLYHLGLIDANGQKKVDLQFLSDKKASAGLVRIPVTLRYTSIDGATRTEASSIDLMMKGKAELGFVSVDSSPRRVGANQPFDLTIRIENTGTGEAKQVVAKTDLPMTGTTQAFLGKIKPGNDAPAVFNLDGVKGGTYPYNVTVTYVDDLGEHTLTRPLSLQVTQSDGTTGIVALLLALLVGGFVAYRYWYLPRKNANGAAPWAKKP